MSEASEIFTELLFGTGAWIGAILILAILVLTAYKNRILCIFNSVISVMLSFMYFENVSGNNDLMWMAVIFLVTPLFLLFRAITMKDD